MEADDVIGTVATRAHEDGFVVAIASPDKVSMPPPLNDSYLPDTIMHVAMHSERCMFVHICNIDGASSERRCLL